MTNYQVHFKKPLARSREIASKYYSDYGTFIIDSVRAMSQRLESTINFLIFTHDLRVLLYDFDFYFEKSPTKMAGLDKNILVK